MKHYLVKGWEMYEPLDNNKLRTAKMEGTLRSIEFRPCHKGIVGIELPNLWLGITCQAFIQLHSLDTQRFHRGPSSWHKLAIKEAVQAV